MKKEGLTHLYIGKGKGKTSAAVGLLIRAHAAKKKVCLIRFLKARASFEVLALKKLKVPVVTFKERHPFFYKSASLEVLRKRVVKDLRAAELILKSKDYDLVVLDEILYLPQIGIAGEGDIVRVIKAKKPHTELVLTGGAASKKIMDMAHYVSTIGDTKHPYKKGITARRGIEY